MTDAVANLLAAAPVSIVGAFGVEWLAKLRLEARKERILRRYHARDEARRVLDSILFAGAALKRHAPAAHERIAGAWHSWTRDRPAVLTAISDWRRANGCGS